ncbi:MAG: hypothetical protein AB7P40_01025 [Chloroflexota bacterium]
MDGITEIRGEGASTPGLGIGRPTFGMTRDQGKRVEVSLSLKSGSTVIVVEELDEALTADILADYAKGLSKDIAEGRPRSFVDSWGSSGQHAWVNLGEVVAFSLRPSK